jgi:hypothetical protein
MDQIKFKTHLQKMTVELVEGTQRQVKNKLSLNIAYIIRPNVRSSSPHLNLSELTKLSELNQLREKALTLEEAVQVLHVDNKVPLWINATVCHSSRKQTLIELNCSRRLRSDDELFHAVDKYAPFHPLIPLPPYHEAGKRFDINWQQQTWKLAWHRWLWKWKNRKKLT